MHKAWLACNNLDWIRGLGAGVAPNTEALSRALDALARGAAKARSLDYAESTQHDVYMRSGSQRRQPNALSNALRRGWGWA